MNDEIRENISCPQFGDNHYGKWGALNLEQRKKIKYLLNKIDNLEMIEKEYIQLQSNWNSLREWLEDYLERNEKWFKQELSDHDKEYYKETYNVADYILDKVLDKMSELEGVDNENNNI